MIAFLTIIYTAVVVVVFRVLKVKPTPWPVALTITSGVLMLGTIVVLWTIAAPISTKAVVSRYVVPIVPYVKGQVVSIPALPNTPLHKGDVLYKVDPTPYQYAVDQAEAQLRSVKSNIVQLQAGIQVAEASVNAAQAGVTADKAAAQVAEAINKANPQAIAKLKLVEAQQQYEASQAKLAQARGNESQSRAALATAQDSVGVAEAQLASARFNLEQCTVRAPADGFITDWQIREGTFVTAMPFAAAGTFIDTTQTSIVAAFPAQMLVHVEPNQPVELAFKSRPGVLYRGEVDTVIQASGEGQFTTGGKLPSAAQVGSPGVLAVKIRLDPGVSVDELEMGSAGSVAIYTDWGKSLAMISKVTIRMKKWLYYLPIPGT
ncbi:Inner membrane protein YibH [Pirellulimonas nuda]|uniref:Inner membrane protein YibH n=1 Tax=Pirellulimonas nuda TaxID=2528009 RepID=A0A518D953_9BACT|nr:biotin/lipoyl-binding protein [Pirellulimonas nuda]QDU88006.1 Inner membrane protein YibH [Pirellulimonas nuda]